MTPPATRPAARTLTPAPMAGIATGVVLLGAGLGFSRVEIAVIGVVVLVAVALALAAGGHPDVSGPHLNLTRAPERTGPDRQRVVPVRVEAVAPGAEIVLVDATAARHRTERIALVGPTGHVVVPVHTAHTGDQELLAAEMVAVGADGAWTAPAPARVRLAARLEPQAVRLPFLPLPPAPAGLTGAHDAARPGDGGEFRDIHPFSYGDRLQRIDWKATARLARRPGDLFVRRSFATSDVEVALILDDADDLTGQVGDWVRGARGLGLPGSLDVAREAAWSFVCAYLDAGDQVSFHVLSRPGQAVRHGSGARHRQRLRAAISATSAQPRMSRTRSPHVARGALIVLLSTFLDDEPVRLVRLWRASGHRVVAVDTLPALRGERLRLEEIVASRIVLGLRADRIDEVRAMGADALVWDGDAGARIAALRTMSRRRRVG
ncbi:DUF58 domain-containing protein [Microbacterium luticocti]|uniref:DUF58 domain-containing protein n=1 Tax=Microbacterium luticocti TaxID=451764 RepID=UPI00041A8E9B|nr:DUF58 domain-containing protein [Microbacterium luticocti]